jgi:glycosyltransferase involved in cell wall biosynthesis
MKSTKILVFLDQIAETTIPYELACSMKMLKGVDIYFSTFKIILSNKERLVENSIILKSYNTFKQLSSLNSFISKNKIDIIHTNHTKGSLLTLILFTYFNIFLKKNKPLWIHTVHNDYNYFNFIQKLIFKRVIQYSDKVICNSQNTFESLPIKKQSSTVIYNGVNINSVRKEKIEKKEKIILSVNRMIPQKNLESLVIAFSHISKKFPDWNLYLCGDGFLRKKIEKTVENLGCEDKVIFFGNINRVEVYKLMNLCTVYVTPSFWEGFCNANVEAMAAGNALINSNVKPLPEIASEAAIYFDPYDIDSLEKAFEKLLENKKLIKKMRQKANTRAEIFDIIIAAKKYRNYFIKK